MIIYLQLQIINVILILFLVNDFYFQHNKSSQNLDVIIEIFSIEGRLVKKIEKYFDNGYSIGPVRWDGTNNYGKA